MIRINLLLPCPAPPTGAVWGDYYYGHSLKKALEDLGAAVRVYYRPQRPLLSRFSLRRGIDLVIRGPYAHGLRLWPGVASYIWLISRDQLTAVERARVRHVFAASKKLTSDLVSQGISASLLLQCTDRDLFDPGRAHPDKQSDVLFVGSLRADARRPILRDAIAAGHRPTVWGLQWRGVIDPDLYAGDFLPNADLGAHYASAKVVLNDHQPAMRAGALISNRVFDVLASGTELVSDVLPDLGISLPGAAAAEGPEAVGAAIEEALAHQESRRAARLTTAAYIRANHTFHHRARAILDVLRGRLK